jgi:quercetin dioxygenase-like cupin family protein
LDTKSELIHLDEIPWEPLGSKTKEVFRKSLSAKAFPSGFKATLTLARPGGEFPEHVDPYTHIFYILEGKGEASLEGRSIPLQKGDTLTVGAGKKHGWRNSGQADLILITLNLFEKEKER